MHRRDGSALGMVLAILERNERAKEIFNELGNVCGLSGTGRSPVQEKGYRVSAIDVRCTDMQRLIAMQNRAASSVWSRIGPKTASALRNQEVNPPVAVWQDHTANYGGCLEAPKPKPLVAKKVNSPYRLKDSTAKIASFLP
ncbi:hypothetical protein EVAR_65195_1 [Eumeta japonica]|uniref:Uncharacterized protein n=1 Tax=Eumeta variegata TaxID=151549 RepID=A0A4C1ZKG9_EUMVA|nr:hypothetical protein EVAR_65195_1 [Eumeta japonica]